MLTPDSAIRSTDRKLDLRHNGSANDFSMQSVLFAEEDGFKTIDLAAFRKTVLGIGSTLEPHTFERLDDFVSLFVTDLTSVLNEANESRRKARIVDVVMAETRQKSSQLKDAMSDVSSELKTANQDIALLNGIVERRNDAMIQAKRQYRNGLMLLRDLMERDDDDIFGYNRLAQFDPISDDVVMDDNTPAVQKAVHAQQERYKRTMEQTLTKVGDRFNMLLAQTNNDVTMRLKAVKDHVARLDITMLKAMRFINQKQGLNIDVEQLQRSISFKSSMRQKTTKKPRPEFTDFSMQDFHIMRRYQRDETMAFLLAAKRTEHKHLFLDPLHILQRRDHVKFEEWVNEQRSGGYSPSKPTAAGHADLHSSGSLKFSSPMEADDDDHASASVLATNDADLLSAERTPSEPDKTFTDAGTQSVIAVMVDRRTQTESQNESSADKSIRAAQSDPFDSPWKRATGPLRRNVIRSSKHTRQGAKHTGKPTRPAVHVDDPHRRPSVRLPSKPLADTGWRVHEQVEVQEPFDPFAEVLETSTRASVKRDPVTHVTTTIKFSRASSKISSVAPDLATKQPIMPSTKKMRKKIVVPAPVVVTGNVTSDEDGEEVEEVNTEKDTTQDINNSMVHKNDIVAEVMIQEPKLEYISSSSKRIVMKSLGTQTDAMKVDFTSNAEPAETNRSSIGVRTVNVPATHNTRLAVEEINASSSTSTDVPVAPSVSAPSASVIDPTPALQDVYAVKRDIVEHIMSYLETSLPSTQMQAPFEPEAKIEQTPPPQSPAVVDVTKKPWHTVIRVHDMKQQRTRKTPQHKNMHKKPTSLIARSKATLLGDPMRAPIIDDSVSSADRVLYPSDQLQQLYSPHRSMFMDFMAHVQQAPPAPTQHANADKSEATHVTPSSQTQQRVVTPRGETGILLVETPMGGRRRYVKRTKSRPKSSPIKRDASKDSPRTPKTVATSVIGRSVQWSEFGFARQEPHLGVRSATKRDRDRSVLVREEPMRKFSTPSKVHSFMSAHHAKGYHEIEDEKPPVRAVHPKRRILSARTARVRAVHKVK